MQVTLYASVYVTDGVRVQGRWRRKLAPTHQPLHGAGAMHPPINLSMMVLGLSKWVANAKGCSSSY